MPAAKQGQVLVRQPDLQSQPWKRMPHLVAQQPQNFSQKFLLFRQGQLAPQPPTHWQGVYEGQGFPCSCLCLFSTTCREQHVLNCNTCHESSHVRPC